MNIRLTFFWCGIFSAALLSCNKDQPTDAGTPPKTETGAPIDTAFAVSEVVGIARIEPPGKINSLQAETAGYIRTVRFQENQVVESGQPLVELDNQLEKVQVQQAQRKVRTQEASIDAARASLGSLQSKLAAARNNLQRENRLLEGNAGTRQAADDARFLAEDLEKQVSAQQAVLAQQQALLEELRTALQLAQTQLDKKTLRAPQSGTFLSCDIKPGNYLQTGAVLGAFAASGPYMAVTEVDELYALRVQDGMAAYIRPQGSQEVLSRGKVVFVSPYLQKKSLFSDRADNLEDRRVREVRVELEQSSRVLIGSRVECVIVLDPR